MFWALGNLKSLYILVHPVFSGEIVTPWEVVHSLVWQQGLEGVGLRMRASPHKVKVRVCVADLQTKVSPAIFKIQTYFMEAVGVEDLTNNLSICLDYLECEVVPAHSWQLTDRIESFTWNQPDSGLACSERLG